MQGQLLFGASSELHHLSHQIFLFVLFDFIKPAHLSLAASATVIPDLYFFYPVLVMCSQI